jgi:hypothetical protein
MKIPKIFRRTQSNPNLPTVVVFAGGMGTQIIQAAVYFSLKHAGRRVYADLSYFDRESVMSEPGNPGKPTHWFWQLDPFGLPKTAFEQDRSLNKQNADILPDGPRMMELGLKALEQTEIQKIFKEVADVRTVLSEEILKDGFFCIHIRRGDYVNVATNLISDAEFIRLIKKFSGLIDHVVLMSDSPIPQDFRNAVTPMFKSANYLDKTDPYTSHQIMRCARILICSNSTFSLTAAALNPDPDTLVVMPKKWFADKDFAIEAPIHANCSFQLKK